MRRGKVTALPLSYGVAKTHPDCLSIGVFYLKQMGFFLEFLKFFSNGGNKNE